MLAIDHDDVKYSSSSVLEQIGRGVAAPLMFIWWSLGLARVVHWVQDEMMRAELVRELSRFDDRYLRDIGIHRADIDGMVRRRHGSRGSAEPMNDLLRME